MEEEENKQPSKFILEKSEEEQEQYCNLERLKSMIDSLKNVEMDIEKIEEQLKEKKASKTRLSQEVIPEYLNKFGLSELRLDDGRKVIINDDISVTVKDKSAFYNWLKTRKEESIIKFTVSFERMGQQKKEELFKFLMEKDYDCNNEEAVHSATQKKYFKELLGIGKESDEIKEGIQNGLIVSVESIESFAKVYTFQKTKIK